MRPPYLRFAPVVCALACAMFALAPATRANDMKAKPGTQTHQEPVIKVKATEGTALSESDEAAVRKLLVEYLEALKQKDYAKAGEMLDRPSLLAAVDPMVGTIAADSTQLREARRRIFGVSTRDSIEARGNGPLFKSLMSYLFSVNPNAGDLLARASIQVLAARRMGEKVHVAYQVSLPPSEPGGLPFEQVTAQQLRKVKGKWRIFFQLDQQ